MVETPGESDLKFSFKPIPGLHKFEQRTCWTYYARVDANFVCEVTRLDRFDLQEMAALQNRPSSNSNIKPKETRWEVCFYDDRWEEHLGRNGILGARHQVGESDLLETIFPPGWDNEAQKRVTGIEVFTKTVSEICQAASTCMPWPEDK